MKNVLRIIFICVSMMFVGVFAMAGVRKPAVSGMFYPSDKVSLREEVENYLKEGGNKKELLNGNGVIGVIAPHAGYSFSGGIAGQSFGIISGRHYDTVIVMGPNHRVMGFSGISVYSEGEYETPLGDVQVDSDLAKKIKNDINAEYVPRVHKWEHSIEVEIPFLQVALSDFKIVPIVMGDYSYNTCNALAEAILKNSKNKKILIVASSDFSHDKPYGRAVEMDKLAIKHIAGLNIKSFRGSWQEKKIELCGYGPVLTLMLLCDKIGGVKGVELDYKNSGDVTGNKEGRIVGYGSVIFIEKESVNSKKSEVNKAKKVENKDDDWESKNNNGGQVDMDNYNINEKKYLLKLARKSIEDCLNNKKTEASDIPSERLKYDRGVFVTLHKNGNLRGCIGYIKPIKPLHRAVIENAVNAATKDFRFPGVDLSELPEIDIEISVLTPPEEVEGAEDFIIGEHGIIIEKGFRNAVFLPQVAPEQGWGREQTLSHLCMKAGLPTDAWKSDDMKFFVFKAQVFGENEIAE